VLERIGDDYGVAVLSPPIPKPIRFAEAPAVGRTVLSTARSTKGAEAYRDLAGQLLSLRH
jgi:chromosome partitioning protein